MDQLDNTMTFVILCPATNIAGLRLTANSIRANFPESQMFAMVGKNIDDRDFKELNKFCVIHKGGDSITSLINHGIDISKTEWNFIAVAGCAIRNRMLNKYLYFRKSEKDILYPVIDRKVAFYEASINGIMVHKNAFVEGGKLSEEMKDICNAKLFWAGELIGKGFQFKALVGAKLF